MWYMGPMFRHERQQKGRYRQHVQIGTEVLGSADPLVVVEVISLLYIIHQALGVRDEVVYLNNLGDLETRRHYVPELRRYLQAHESELDPDSKARSETNPLRTFDSNNKNAQALLAEAPKIGDFLSEEDRKSTRLNSSHANISYAVFCLKKKIPIFFCYCFPA